MWKRFVCILFAVTSLQSASVFAQQAARSGDVLEDGRRIWVGLDLGTGSVESRAPAPSAGRSGVAASVELGYRLTTNWGAGLEWGTIAPQGGCAQWQCGTAAADFAPNIGHAFLFGEYRTHDSGWRFRAGTGLSRFCYQRHWNDGAWSVWDTVLALFDDDYLFHVGTGSGAYRCDAARNALGGSASVGYDWRLRENGPVLFGARLTAEAANFSGGNGGGPAAFHHRALMFTLHLVLN